MSIDMPPPDIPPSLVRRFLSSAAAGGVMLMLSAMLALILANSPASEIYFSVLHAPVGGLSVLHWINDGLMAVFFLMVGLEIKREVLDGQLSTWPRRILPGVAALGGIVVPAMVFFAFNSRGDGYPEGWAIPAATDIAFALGVISLLGPRVPMSLRIFLAALAIIDDLIAVLIIALFYTSDINFAILGICAVAIAGLVLLNRMKVTSLSPYLVMGCVLWFLFLHSGVHATLAGVVLALCISLRKSPAKPDDRDSPLHILEHGIAPWVTFLIVPLFGLANAGIPLANISIERIASPLPFGIAAGLFIGKQVGVFSFAAIAIRMGWAELPMYASWRQLYGVSLLCGIGFTMSLFIGLMAFPDSLELQEDMKLGVLLGSLLSAAAGIFLLRQSSPRIEPGECRISEDGNGHERNGAPGGIRTHNL